MPRTALHVRGTGRAWGTAVNRSLALSLFAGLALSLSAVACGGHVDSGPGTGQNGVPSRAGSSSVDPPSPRTSGVNAIVTSSGELKATNATYTCQKPTAPICSTRTVWELHFEFGPDALVPGTYKLSDPSLDAFYSISGPNPGASDCWGGGGSFLQGQLVIDQVDATTVHFHLVDTNQNDSVDGLDSDGSYVAVRCD